MTKSRVLIVEDEILIALDVEGALVAAGYEVCGVAGSQADALAMADATHPDLAVVDVSLGPGDGRVVARELFARHSTQVLFATGQCDEIRGLARSGAVACLPKPYRADDVPRALQAVSRIRRGHPPGRLPNAMFALDAA